MNSPARYLSPATAASRIAAIVRDTADEERDNTHGFWEATQYRLDGQPVAEIMRSGSVYLDRAFEHLIPADCKPVGRTNNGGFKFTVTGTTSNVGGAIGRGKPTIPPVDCPVCLAEHADDEPHRW